MTAGLALAALLALAEVPTTLEAVPYYHPVSPTLATAGQPDAAGLDAVKAAGFRTVISLELEEDPGAKGEKERVESRGMRFLRVPLTASSLSRADGEAVAKALAEDGASPVLLHCTVAIRAGGMIALLDILKGVPLEDALAHGRKAGMTREGMADAVRRVAAEEPK
jgi:uncharacterized protein (TIGR01244 family)